jgi:hypothetical protein
LGLGLVVLVAAADPYTSFNHGYGWTSSGHFPQGPVFLLVLFTVFVNFAVKLVRRRWALRQSELLLMWCMLIVSCTVASNGLMRYWFSTLAGPPYIARRADILWKDTALETVPDSLLLTKDPKSLAAKWFFEQKPDDSALPWRPWVRPIAHWLGFILPFYLAVLLMCALLRKQWVENERLQFPLARIPLDFTEGSAGPGLFPSLFGSKAFLWGIIISAATRFLRALPLLFGADSGWALQVPLKDVFQDTPLNHLYLENFSVWWDVMGFAYFVPADVSLSVWLFYLFGRVELQTASWLGSPLHYGGTWGELFQWQTFGSYIVFTVGALFMARRHLAAIVRKAVGRGRGVDDSDEVVGYGVGFWGFVLFSGLAVAWFAAHGMKLWVGIVMLLLGLCMMFVHARIVCQSGLHFTQPVWRPPNVVHGLSFGRAFGSKGVIVAAMEDGIAVPLVLLSAGAMNSFRISEVFRRKRLLLPALVTALFIAIAASGWTSLWQAYHDGALNYSDTWGATGQPKGVFDGAHYKMENPSQANQVRWSPLAIGAVLTGAVMFLRARFYWWPIHPIGLLAISNWYADRIWLPFLLGWLIKKSLMRFGSGRMVHAGRLFFIGFILTEYFVGGCSTIVRTLTAGAVPGF